MMNAGKYQTGYYPPPEAHYLWPERDHIEKAPVWCSVDLRDGNQSLVIPMDIHEKLAYFRMLAGIGFKQIEVGFPAASQTEFIFLRTLIEKHLIPDDVTIQVLTQCREPIIRRTFSALKGAKKAIVHFYNPISRVQREQVFRMSRDEILQIAVDGAKLVRQLGQESDTDFTYEYSPESFTGTEPAFALEVCNAVLDVIRPVPEKPMIINLPVTVEMSMPHIYANQVEWCSSHLKYRDSVILSTHPHNDRGTGIADAEFALLAGAQRVECCLFGNGERTGNVDAVTLALNLYTHGVDPQLDFSDLPAIKETYEQLTHMEVPARQPYSGSLVFAAFSGGHQDAIAKSMTWYRQHPQPFWNCPYIPIDPTDIGRTYDADVIRINSQSGKGGIGFLLEQNYGYSLPPKMREDLSRRIKHISESRHKELSVGEVHDVFAGTYLDVVSPLEVLDTAFAEKDGVLFASVRLRFNGREQVASGMGNGRLNAVTSALKEALGIRFHLESYTEHSLDAGSAGRACSYVCLRWEDQSTSWGAGTDTDIIRSGIKALASAVNTKPGGPGGNSKISS